MAEIGGGRRRLVVENEDLEREMRWRLVVQLVVIRPLLLLLMKNRIREVIDGIEHRRVEGAARVFIFPQFSRSHTYTSIDFFFFI
ncbi:hypothetical protein Hanom_Chr02g00165781 [Helianthus anomalus]